MNGVDFESRPTADALAASSERNLNILSDCIDDEVELPLISFDQSGAPEGARLLVEESADELTNSASSSPSSGLGPLFNLHDLWSWVRDNGLQEAKYLPLLGMDGYIREGGSHLLSAYPKSGKSTLLVQAALNDWRHKQVLFISEESEELWQHRCSEMLKLEQEPYANVTICDVRALPVESLRDTVEAAMLQQSLHHAVVIIDTVRDVFGIEDENDNALVAAALAPMLKVARGNGQTLILVHHASKAGARRSKGDGLSVSGAHAFVSGVDTFFELGAGRQDDERQIKGRSRFGDIKPLTYRRSADGYLSPVSDRFEAPEKWASTQEIADLWVLSSEQASRILKRAAERGEVERDPPLDVNANGKRVSWRRAP